MLSTNFNEEHPEQINAILDFVSNNSYSTLYREKYGNKNFQKISSHENFQLIPFLEKHQFCQRDIADICHVPQEEIKYYSTSSGASSKIPTVIPFSDFNFELLQKSYFNDELLRSLGVNNVLSLLVPNSGPLMRVLKSPNRKTILVPGDIYNLPLAAKICNELPIQGLITSPSRLNEFILHLTKEGYDFSQMKWISLGHELFPSSMLDYFKLTFPLAYFKIHYGISEIGGARGYRCEHLKDASPEILHPTPTLIEIADEDGNILPLDKIGEIIHTDLQKKAFPLIRYRTGDMARLKKASCPCGNKLYLILEGRKNVDYIEHNGFIIRSRDMANCIASISSFVELRFQLHVYKKNAPLKLVLDLKLKEEVNKISDDEFINMLSSKITDTFYPKKDESLTKLIVENEIAPLEINFIKEWPNPREKAKYIILHE